MGNRSLRKGRFPETAGNVVGGTGGTVMAEEVIDSGFEGITNPG